MVEFRFGVSEKIIGNQCAASYIQNEFEEGTGKFVLSDQYTLDDINFLDGRHVHMKDGSKIDIKYE